MLDTEALLLSGHVHRSQQISKLSGHGSYFQSQWMEWNRANLHFAGWWMGIIGAASWIQHPFVH